MGTRCMIAAQFSQEVVGSTEVVASYCHFDGDLAGVGLVLLKEYNNEDAAFWAADLGYMSSLPEEPYTFSDTDNTRVCHPSYFKTAQAYLDNARDSDLEFLYLYLDDKWYFARFHTTNGDWSEFMELKYSCMTNELLDHYKWLVWKNKHDDAEQYKKLLDLAMQDK